MESILNIKEAKTEIIHTVQAYLDILNDDYAPGSVTRLLKAGLSDISREETDLLDNYVRQTGVRGYNAWHREFTKIRT